MCVSVRVLSKAVLNMSRNRRKKTFLRQNKTRVGDYFLSMLDLHTNKDRTQIGRAVVFEAFHGTLIFLLN